MRSKKAPGPFFLILADCRRFQTQEPKRVQPLDPSSKLRDLSASVVSYFVYCGSLCY